MKRFIRYTGGRIRYRYKQVLSERYIRFYWGDEDGRRIDGKN